MDQPLKNDGFKTFFSNGIIGGVSLNGNINLNFFIDRVPIPEYTTHKVVNNGLTFEKEPFDAKTKQGSVREVQIGIELDTSTAYTMIEWLKTHIEIIETARKK